MHHGVKGQKWGVRRYQNKDGSLTELGKLRVVTLGRESYPYGVDKDYRDKVLKKYQKDGTITKYGLRQISKATQKYGVIDSDDTPILSKDYYDPYRNIEVNKDTELFRFASSYDQIDHKRKYVAVGKEARSQYDNPDVIIDMLGIPWGDDIDEFTYAAKKNLRIMNGEQAVNLVLDKYGKALSDTIKLDSVLSKIDIDRSPNNSRSLSKADKELLEYRETVRDTVDRSVRALYDKNVDDIASEAKKMGYDAVVDLMDMSFADSIVLTDPQTSIKLKAQSRYR